MRPTYLAGPINGRSDVDARAWRAEAVALLAALDPGTPTLDPMVRDFRGRETEAGVAAEIVQGDKADIDRCGAVLLRWDGGGSAGTTMELLYAAERGIPVFVWDDRPSCETRRPLSPWVTFHARAILSTLRGACAALAGTARR